ncbi:MAG: DUF4255 domain-containing protein [Bacteroidota bacterium]
MIKPALAILQDEIEQFVTNQPNAGWISDYAVQLANVTNLGFDDDAKYNDSILLSLISTEQDSTLRNAEFKRYSSASSKVTYHNPKISLNLNVLVCTKFTHYANALEWLSQVIEFFQSKNVFTAANTPKIHDYQSLSAHEKMTFKLIADFHSLNFEQLNNLWGTLGRNLMPHFLLKVRLIKIFNDQIHKTGPSITQITARENIL